MAELSTVGRPYANAIFRLAKQGSQLGEWSRMLAVIAATADDPRVKLFLDSPETPNAVKAQRLGDICGEEVDDRGRRFLRVLAENDRLDLIAAVREQFEELKAQEEKILEVEVVSAFPVSSAEEQSLKQALERKYEKDVVLASRVDTSLIGGAIIRAGDTVIDGSLRGKLDKLAENLLRT
ncbi:MAG: F0F1 ATP synthase subunit delta [Pseudomonadales bacterium]